MTLAEQTTSPVGRRVHGRDPVHADISDFLIDEAIMLDEDRHLEWLDLLCDDIVYDMPGRRTVYRKERSEFDESASHFEDDRISLGLRARRNVEIKSAYDRDPAPRVRRLISSVVVHESLVPDEYHVRSHILVLRNRFDEETYETLSACRLDVLRSTPDGYRIARRTILIDQAILGAPFFNVFM